jgi:hypothetical protein
MPCTCVNHLNDDVVAIHGRRRFRLLDGRLNLKLIPRVTPWEATLAHTHAVRGIWILNAKERINSRRSPEL